MRERAAISGRDRTPRSGFTLVEVLVVVAVIALLLGLLLPALAKASEQGRQMVCLNNARDISMAAQSYAADNGGLWPVFPSEVRLTTRQALFNSWEFGGKTTSDYWAAPSSRRLVGEAPLNPYVAYDTVLKDPPGSRLELPTFRCPSDPGTLQRTFWNSNTIPDARVTCYDDVGTSYHMNVQWWYEALRKIGMNAGGQGTLDVWNQYRTMFNVANFKRPSQFAWMYDQSMDFIAVGGYSKLGDHGGENKATAAFMDGHVKYLTVEPKAADTSEYTLFYERYYRR